MLIFDGHLDIAYNALVHERDPRWSVDETRQRELDPPCDDGRGECTTSFVEMREAGVAVALTTLLGRAKPWVKPGRPHAFRGGDWPTQEMVHAWAHGQLAYYREMERQGEVRILETAPQLRNHWAQWQQAVADGSDTSKLPIGLIITMECADPTVAPDRLYDWHKLGLRTLLLTHFGQGQYAAGNPSEDAGNPHDLDGPITPRGRELLREMVKLGMPLDLTHLSDTSFWDAIEYFPGQVYSSHSNCRAISDQQRQFSDDMIRAVLERDGVLGVALPINMIRLDLIEGPPWTPLKHEVKLEHLADHIDHICQLAGSAEHVALGTDTDGGFGSETCPHGYDRHRDIHVLSEILGQRGYPQSAVTDIFYGNWLRFYQRVLPT
ncbi:dipeptidase [Algisphaera agarilytica]|uniref:Membrane dipeptidase n=1 Tax=Algisphaera agarilytica TaxID=1385975 RepID=A0A7X0LM13_9BACT|nr:membrane dipeptidase [Algisphaera agarilytica]MBB6431176.1 membrane dipeptidase [Algisphaera agarilytica]